VLIFKNLNNKNVNQIIKKLKEQAHASKVKIKIRIKNNFQIN
jgi:hypothetical protein